MITQNTSEIELEIRDRIKRAESVISIKEPKKKDQAAAERQRILAVLAGMRRQFIREMENLKSPEDDPDVLLVLNAKIVAIEQAIDEIERNRQ